MRHHLYPYLKILEKDPHKIWVALKEYYITLLSQNKYNDQNIKMKFGGMKFKMNFKETPRNITNIRVLTKAKAFFRNILKHDNFQVCQKCDYHNHITKSGTLLNIWLIYTWNILVNEFKGTNLKHTSTLWPTKISCSKMFLRNTMKMFYRTK